jgi:hypothetical protein
MEERRLGFVVAGAMVYKDRVGPRQGRLFMGDAGTESVNPAYLQVVPLARSVVGGSGLERWDVPQLEGLMPIFASVTTVYGAELALPAAWVLERVPGARLEGTAEPGARVVARTRFETPVGILPYEAWTTADAAGSFRIVVPVPNGEQMGGFRTGPAMRVSTGLWEVEVVVPIEAVRAGTTLAVPAPPG